MTVTLGVLAALEGGLAIGATLSEDVRDGVRSAAQTAARGWSASNGAVTGAGTNLYRGWIEPMWARSDTTTPAAMPAFAKCVSCHPDYGARQRFGEVYMDHPLHAQQAVACRECHQDIEHPAPQRVREDTCATCHEEVSQLAKCEVCHPPGTLAHFYLLGAPRDRAPTCESCHTPGSFQGDAARSLVKRGAMTGADDAVCSACHQPRKCEQCHADDHPPDWATVHGRTVVDGDASCDSCHRSSWCAACHSRAARVPQPDREER